MGEGNIQGPRQSLSRAFGRTFWKRWGFLGRIDRTGVVKDNRLIVMPIKT